MGSEINVYTDGSASVAGSMKGYSGFGCYFPDLFGKPKAFSIGFEKGKTGEMEVLALLYAIKQMPFTEVILNVYSDSEYVVKTFTEDRLQKWKSNGWTNTSGEVANKNLWIKIDREVLSRPKMKLNLIHIRSHQVDKEKDPDKKKLLMSNPHIVGNLMADKLADYKRHTTRLAHVGCLDRK